MHDLHPAVGPDRGVEADLSPPSGERYRRLSLWWDGLPDPIGRPGAPARRPRRGRGHRRRRLHRAVDGLLPGRGRPAPAHRRPRARRGRLRGLGAQRRLVLGPVRRVRATGSTGTAGPGAGPAMRRAMEDTVGEVGRVVGAEGIDCGFAHGGTVVLARTGAQLAAGPRGGGRGPCGRHRRGRPPPALGRRGGGHGRGHRACSGGTYTPHCAAVDPARLVRGLAEAVERRGRGHLRADRGPGHPARRGGDDHGARCGRTPWCGPPRATPGPCRARSATLVPVYSLMIATEPLPDAFWAEAGLAAAGDLRRPPPPGHLRPAHRRRPPGLRRPGRAVPLRLGHPARVRPRRRRARGPARTRWSSCSRRWPTSRSPTGGAVRSASPATGSPRWASTGRPAWPGPAATWATGCRPPTWPGGPCATSSSAATPS